MKDKTAFEVNIRHMRKKDIPWVKNIEELSFPFPWSAQLLYVELEKKDFAYYRVIEFNKLVVGYGGYWKVIDEAHIVTFAIHPAYRGRGLGTMLLDNILKDASSRKVKKVTLEVRESNTVAQNLYQKFDFKKIAIRKHYYQDTGEDAYVYWKEL